MQGPGNITQRVYLACLGLDIGLNHRDIILNASAHK